MKKLSKIFSALAIIAFLGITSPVVAQTDTGGTGTTTMTHDDDDRGFDDWGLLGLLGLAGLLGRKRNNDTTVRRTDVNR